MTRSLRRLARRAWRAWVRFWIEPEPPVRRPPRAEYPYCTPNIIRRHPLPGHPTLRVIAEDADEALSVIAGGIV